MSPFFKLGLALAVVAWCSGCRETEQTVWLNPDGSGKVEMTIRYQPGLLTFFEADGDVRSQADTFTRLGLEDRAARLVERTQGVTAWEQVSMTLLEDGGARFQGTAYFDTIDRLDFTAVASGYRFQWQTNRVTGGGTLTIRQRLTDHLPERPHPPGQLDDALRTRMQHLRADFRRLRAFLLPQAGMDAYRVTVYLPGTVQEVVNLVPNGGSAVTLQPDSLAVMNAWDHLMHDDDTLAGLLALPDYDDSSPSRYRYELALAYAALGPHVVTVAPPLTPRFAYAVRVAEAQRQEAVMWEQLARQGELLRPETVPGDGVHVLGTVWRRDIEAHAAGGWSWGAPTCRVYLVAGLRAEPEQVPVVRILEAVCPAGRSLRPGGRERLPLRDVTSGQDRRSWLLAVDVDMPASGAMRVKRLRGELEYRVQGGSREVDLEFETLQEQSAGRLYEAEITRSNRGIWSGRSGVILRLSLQVPAGLQIQGVRVRDAQGREIPADSRRTARASRRTEYSLMPAAGGAFPDHGTLVLIVREPPRLERMPFEFSEIPIDKGGPPIIQQHFQQQKGIK